MFGFDKEGESEKEEGQKDLQMDSKKDDSPEKAEPLIAKKDIRISRSGFVWDIKKGDKIEAKGQSMLNILKDNNVI